MSQEYNYFCPPRHGSGVSFGFVLLSDTEKTRSRCSYTKSIATPKRRCHQTMTGEAILFKQVIPPSLKKKSPVIELSVSNRTSLKGPLGCASFQPSQSISGRIKKCVEIQRCFETNSFRRLTKELYVLLQTK